MAAPETATSPRQAHVEWHAKRIAELTRADGWLTLIGLFWLDDGRHRIGSAADCAVRLPAGPALFGELAVTGNRAEWQAADGTSLALKSDAGGDATVVRWEHLSFFLIERDGRLALRLRDTEASTRFNFSGITCFDFDPAWRLEARWDGQSAHFSRQGADYALSPQNPKADPLHFVIADATSGRETYGGGRFLHAPEAADDKLILDFNRAVNPPCAFTAFAVCPLPPAGNRLPFPVSAGEMAYTAAK